MKTATLKLKRKVLVIELPKGTKHYQYNNAFETISAEVPNDKGVSFEQIRIEKGYTLLGSPDDLKEEDVIDLVESWESVAKDGTRAYQNYKDGIPKKRTALESFNSALEKEILWENPYAEPDKFIDGFDNPCYEWWHEAESRTFDRTRTLIFVENKLKIKT